MKRNSAVNALNQYSKELKTMTSNKKQIDKAYSAQPIYLHKRKNLLIFGATTSAFLLLLTGCVVSSDETPKEGAESDPSGPISSSEEEGEEELDPIASTKTSSTELGHDFQIDVYALERLQNNILRLSLDVTNKSNENFRIFDGLSEPGDERTASEISLLDTENQERYLSLNLSDGTCFCHPLDGSVEPGSSQSIWVAFPEPPDGINSMTITTPLTPPLFDIPISNSTESLENDGIQEPEILDITIISDDIEDQTGRTESGEEVSIILSSDVLFDTNSAEINEDTQEILEQVADEVDEATGEVVNIDGYADNTGDESINLPLSEERGEAVKEAISKIVNRSVDFQVEGHGSAEPIADNSTEEGRERNRRVTVSFNK